MLLINNPDKYVLACDWLQFSGVLDMTYYESIEDVDVEVPECYRAVIVDGTNIFKNRMMVYDNKGTKLLTILWRPKSRMMDERLITFEVANSVFYTERIGEVLQLSNMLMKYSFLSIGRIDISLDFEFGSSEENVVRGLYNGTMYVVGKRNGSSFWSKIKDEVFPHCLSFGSKRSDFNWKLYNKSKELDIGALSAKPYIWRMWEVLKLDINNVWRLEISLNNLGKHLINGSMPDLVDVVRDSWLLNVFLMMKKTRFEIRLKNSGSRRDRDKRVDFLEMKNLEYSMIRKGSVKKNEIDIHTRELNRMLELIESPSIMVSEDLFEMQSQLISTYVAKWYLHRYFYSLKGMRPDEYFEKVKNEVGLGKLVVHRER